MPKIKKQDALDYHSQGRKGKIEVIPTKPTGTQRDLSLAYSPGVAEPCLAIHKDPSDVYKYTAKGNLVAVISNGTAVLGLGDIGPLASKPVMEGKGVLFKMFADLDVFDIEIDAQDIDRFVQTVKAISPTFGGINLEDIKAPEAFEIERRLKEELDIPIMHDDQHGTAIISGAALLNAAELANKSLADLKIVISGAGAAAISCAQLYVRLGVKRENMIMFDSKGAITADRSDLDAMKQAFAVKGSYRDLAHAMEGADVFLGLSKGNIVSADMLKKMADNPIVFACANPDPEINYETAMKARKDVIMATGRSDHPNQVNNVLGFPYIFRGAMDVRATCINEEMKLAAVYALANLAKEPIPEEVNVAYGAKNLSFGRENIIPKPFDPRLITAVSMAVAKAAMDSGVAKNPISDWEGYERELKSRLGKDQKLIRNMTDRAKKNPKRLVFADADNYKVLKAAQIVREERIAIPILLGSEEKIKQLIKEYKFDFDGIQIIDPRSDKQKEKIEQYSALLYSKRQRKGMSEFEAKRNMLNRTYYSCMMVEAGDADACISGITRSYPEVLKPALHCMGLEEGISRLAGAYIMTTKDGPIFFADTTVNINPTAEELVEIAVQTAKTVKKFGLTPRVAMLSYSNFGSANGEEANKVAKATQILHAKHPDLIVDGEIQANFALNQDMMAEQFPFSRLVGKKVNTLIFPNLAAGNIAYKLLDEMGHVQTMGPILMGLKKSFHVLTLGCSVKEIVNLATIAVLDAQTKN
ncbi:MAG TPA: NADP-dependent malic enzyme [Luteibaculaceae bacterium]|nr:NADP-dependent malic enzyme [Luteibaculaceae bacterium]